MLLPAWVKFTFAPQSPAALLRTSKPLPLLQRSSLCPGWPHPRMHWMATCWAFGSSTGQTYLTEVLSFFFFKFDVPLNLLAIWTLGGRGVRAFPFMWKKVSLLLILIPLNFLNHADYLEWTPYIHLLKSKSVLLSMPSACTGHTERIEMSGPSNPHCKQADHTN